MKTKKISFGELFPLIEEKMKSGESFSFLAFGNSMLPFLRNGKDVVTLSPVSSPIKKNDVIFYRRKNGQFVLHRVVKILESGDFVLCGDNQFQLERGITEDQIIAILTEVKRGKKSISLSSFSQKVYLFFLPVKRNFLLYNYKIKNRILRCFKQN